MRTGGMQMCFFLLQLIATLSDFVDTLKKRIQSEYLNKKERKKKILYVNKLSPTVSRESTKQESE